MFTVTDVVERGVCVGCGGCAIATKGAIRMVPSATGSPVADLSAASPEDLAAANRVCPFSDLSRDENEIAAKLYADLPDDPRIGRYEALYAGRVSDDGYLDGSSSGGMTSWIVGELLRAGEIDGVVHVTSSGSFSKGLFRYTISASYDEYVERRKSNYYATSFDAALADDRLQTGRYAFVGVPCFVTSLRNLTQELPELRARFPFVVGLVCGHLKSPGFAHALAWQAGVAPTDLRSVDFRIKRTSEHAGRYDFGAVRESDGALLTAPTQQLVGGNWGHNMFQVNSCNFCDDIFAETADVALGDAWLPRYKSNPRGTNVVVVRNPIINEILQAGRASGALTLDDIAPDDVAATQGGNFRHRRDGLRVRLADDIRDGRAVPRKRVEPGYDGLSGERIALVRHRRRMVDESERSLAESRSRGSIQPFLFAMRRSVLTYMKLDGESVPARVKWLVATSALGRRIKK